MKENIIKFFIGFFGILLLLAVGVLILIGVPCAIILIFNIGESGQGLLAIIWLFFLIAVVGGLNMVLD